MHWPKRKEAKPLLFNHVEQNKAAAMLSDARTPRDNNASEHRNKKSWNHVFRFGKKKKYSAIASPLSSHNNNANAISPTFGIENQFSSMNIGVNETQQNHATSRRQTLIPSNKKQSKKQSNSKRRVTTGSILKRRQSEDNNNNETTEILTEREKLQRVSEKLQRISELKVPGSQAKRLSSPEPLAAPSMEYDAVVTHTRTTQRMKTWETSFSDVNFEMTVEMKSEDEKGNRILDKEDALSSFGQSTTTCHLSSTSKHQQAPPPPPPPPPPPSVLKIKKGKGKRNSKSHNSIINVDTESLSRSPVSKSSETIETEATGLTQQSTLTSTTSTKESSSHDQNDKPSSNFHRSNSIHNADPATFQTKALLSRSFGRKTLPHSIGRKWIVEVSAAEWDNEENNWKYRVYVCKQGQGGSPNSSSKAVAWRSLESFCCLEKNLRQEYGGGLLVPLLSITLGTSDMQQVTHEVDSSLLRDWLCDIMNGLRGQGEIIMNHELADVISSESMEAFLYRNDSGTSGLSKSKSLFLEPDPQILVENAYHSNQQRDSSRFYPNNKSSNAIVNDEENSFVQTLWSGKNPFSLFELDAVLCGKYNDNNQSSNNITRQEQWTCSSRALATATTLNIQDSFVEMLPGKITLSAILKKRHYYRQFTPAVSVKLLEAQRQLCLSYRRKAMTVMETIQLLVEDEVQVGVAWKRFAIALSNLFAFEKDVESSKMGDLKANRDLMPYRKVSKSGVDDCIRMIAKYKAERASPCLKDLNAMITAYVADLSAVSPSVDEYFEAVYRLSMLDEIASEHNYEDDQQSLKKKSSLHHHETKESTWQDQLLESFPFIQGRSSSATFSQSFSSEASESNHNKDTSYLRQKKASQIRMRNNGRMLKASMFTLCQATTVRMARMAYLYFNSEVNQCALLHSAAVSLRSQIDVVKKENVAIMLTRHREAEHQDDCSELALIQRTVNLGTRKKYAILTPGTNPEAEVEIDTDAQGEEREKASLRDRAIHISQKRLGRWDAKIAMAIMEAVGVDDPNIRVDETSRELRMVRKYAIGLREQLTMCIDALNLLKQAVLKGCKQSKKINECRKDHIMHLAKLFSGTYSRDYSSSSSGVETVEELNRAGIYTKDPLDWGYAYDHRDENRNDRGPKQVSCGEPLSTYLKARDAQAEWLLSSIQDLLDDYTKRVEVVESFVYMECVGHQLEKFFSKKRGTALEEFEKKTDITTAINAATRKRLKSLVAELQEKLDTLGSDVTHTSVKEAKEAHLESKQIKLDLHQLAVRRLMRVRESSTERVVSMISLWAKEEERTASVELKALGSIMATLEEAVKKENIEACLYRVEK